jgi:hypothetical protein
MKLISLAAILLVFSVSGSYGQTLDRNNAIKKNYRDDGMENFSVIKQYEMKDVSADTSGNGQINAEIMAIRTIIDDIGKSKQQDSIGGEIQKIVKKKENKIKVTKADSSLLIGLLNEKNKIIQKENDSLKMKYRLLGILAKQKTVKDSLSVYFGTAKEIRVKALTSIEALRLYRNGFDSTKSISSKSELKDSVANSIANLIVLEDEVRNISKVISASQGVLKRIPQKLTDIDTVWSAELDKISVDFVDIRSDLSVFTNELKRNDSIWKYYFIKYVKTKLGKPVEVSALPFFSTIPGLKDVNGSINVIGNNIPKTVNGNYLEFGLFTGVLKSGDSSNAYNVFISEVSNYAFYFKSNTGFVQERDSITKLAVNTAVFYANKPINKDSVAGVKSNFNSSFFQGKFGIEYVVYRNLFSAYFNANAISPVTNKALFDQRFVINTDIIAYADFGFRMLLNTSMKVPDGLKLYFDLNFLVNTDELKKFNPGGTDILVPNFRVGLRANLGRI